MTSVARTAAAAMVLSCAGAAVAAPTVTAFGGFMAAHGDNPNVNGAALVTYAPLTNKTNTLVSVEHLLPNTTYGVFVFGPNSLFSNPAAFTTNSFGQGAYWARTDHDQATSANLIIFIDENANGRPYDDNGFIEENELRAIGIPL